MTKKSSLTMGKVIEYSEDDALDDDVLDDDALDVNFENDSPLPSSLEVNIKNKVKKAALKKGRFNCGPDSKELCGLEKRILYNRI